MFNLLAGFWTPAGRLLRARPRSAVPPNWPMPSGLRRLNYGRFAGISARSLAGIPLQLLRGALPERDRGGSALVGRSVRNREAAERPAAALPQVSPLLLRRQYPRWKYHPTKPARIVK